MATTQQVCIKWKITFSTEDRPRFTADFINGLTMLDEASNSEEAERKKAYVGFTRHFGTHHLVQASYGASIFIHQMLTTNSIMETQVDERKECVTKASNECTKVNLLIFSLESCISQTHSECESDKNTTHSGQSSSLQDVLISTRGSDSINLADFHTEDRNLVPIGLDVAFMQDLMRNDWLEESIDYGFERSLNDTAINLLLEEGLKKWYCDQVLALPEEQCRQKEAEGGTTT